MTERRNRKKRSEKLSDSFVARLSREIGPSDRLDGIAGSPRAAAADLRRERAALASHPSRPHAFIRCPHCREYVPVRDICRGCGTPID